MEKTRIIESYLDGSMNPEEREKFEKSIAEDSELASEVALSKDINDAILDEGTVHFRKVVRNIIDNNTNRFRKVLKVLNVPLAASIILLIGFSFWQILSVKSPAEIYSTYYKPYLTDLSSRSSNTNTGNTDLAYKLYQEGNYKASFELLQNFLASNSDDQTAHFYSGLNAVELGMFNSAIEELKRVEKDLASPFSLHARWYLAMIYLQLNQPEDARKYLLMLSSQENMYSENVRSILKKLKD
jgi:tetratricopeptide (TPR) repeat protein